MCLFLWDIFQKYKLLIYKNEGFRSNVIREIITYFFFFFLKNGIIK